MTNDQRNTPPVVLTIAGLDPSGGAGVVADVKTFTAFGCFACAAITSLTFQNTAGVYGASHQSAEVLRAQVMPVVEDFRVAALKTGMLPTREVIMEVARLVRETPLRAAPFVLDPVVRSTSGYDLIDDDALAALKRELLPLSLVATPNVPEAERITGLKIEDEEGMRRAAIAMRGMGARAVLVKGGHLAGDALDVLDDEGRVEVFRAPRIASTSTHGTGCTLAAAIVACLARGVSLAESVSAAKRYVTASIAKAPRLGHGYGPVSHDIRVEFTPGGVKIDGA
ncbi:MAG: bifunctional hydroxymethylpyrimidine kinase/phosphomethylpyrimidine kinase [Acidobacteria bacterium]|nr:bifunctional hydroxymethylpyrimidine kinase/phosphomethylpyrimidine kinase [Acidobacteriota bacterium]MCA1640764.1 bifunctional hydroxymethylpyrimidine kinase/phosphomethylpyrimidine kinase [Acidobacteriota bacterium]